MLPVAPLVDRAQVDEAHPRLSVMLGLLVIEYPRLDMPLFSFCNWGLQSWEHCQSS